MPSPRFSLGIISEKIAAAPVEASPHPTP